jgi:hypothetical protein
LANASVAGTTDNGTYASWFSLFSVRESQFVVARRALFASRYCRAGKWPKFANEIVEV